MNPKLKKMFKISLIVCVTLFGLFFIFITSLGVWLINKKSYVEIPRELLLPNSNLQNKDEKPNSTNLLEALPESSESSKAEQNSDTEDYVKKYNSDYQSIKKDPVRMAIMMVQVVNFFEKVGADLHATAAPSMCNFICGDALLDERIADTVGLPYLVDFYQHEKNRAFEDFEFRRDAEAFYQVSKIFPLELREAMLKVLTSRNEGTLEQAEYVIQAQYYVAIAVSKFNKYKAQIDRLDKTMEALKSLRKTCGNQPENLVQERCEKALVEGPLFVSLE